MSSEGTPLHGDRGAWNVIDFDTEHAKDIMDSTLRRHLPLPGADGGYARSDGADWQRVSSLDLADLAGYVRGYIIRGGASGWEAYSAETDGAALVGDGTDIISDLTPLWKGKHAFNDGFTFNANCDGSGTFDTNVECALAGGDTGLQSFIYQTDGTGMTGTLRGAYLTASGGNTANTGTIRGAEIKARAGRPGETGNDVAVLEGFSVSSDAKTYDVTTHRGGEIILDGGAGTSTLAVGLRIANNFQANRATTSYGLQIYRDSFDYTADIQLSSGGTIGGANGDLRIDTNGVIAPGQEINAATAAEPVLILQTTDDDATNPYIDLQNSGAAMPYVMKLNGSRFIHTYGTDNVFIGADAGNFTTLGDGRNVGIGTDALQALTSGRRNVCIGRGAGTALTSGESNFFLGEGAGLVATTAKENVGIGTSALFRLTSGQENVCIGVSAGVNLTSGGKNMCIGKATGLALTTGVRNLFIGSSAGLSTTTGFNNVALGTNALDNHISGHGNVAIGSHTARITTIGSRNITIGYLIDPTANNANDELNIGALIYGDTAGGMAGINVTPPNLAAAWHMDQATDDAAIPVAIFDQADVSEEIFELISTIGVGNAIEAVGAKALTTTHFFKITIPGGLIRYAQVGTIA